MTAISGYSLGHIQNTYRRPRAFPANQLTEREIEILKLIADALTDAQIGMRLGITAVTVKSHGAHIREKIGADNRVAMAMYAVRKGIVIP